MKKIFIISSFVILVTASSSEAANIPFKVKITEEQHNPGGQQQIIDLLKLNTEKDDAAQTITTEIESKIILNPFNDPFVPQIPKPPEPTTSPQDIGGVTSAPSTIPTKQSKPAVQKPSLTISGIIWNSDRPQAIINNQVVDVGTTFDNTTVVAINKTGIDVLYSGEKFNIPYN